MKDESSKLNESRKNRNMEYNLEIAEEERENEYYV